LPCRAACEGTVTWRGTVANILPAWINGNQRQATAVSSFRFQVNGQGKTVSKVARPGSRHALAACLLHSMGGHMGPPLRRRAERVSRRGSPTWLPAVSVPRVRRSPAPPLHPAAVPRVCFRFPGLPARPKGGPHSRFPTPDSRLPNPDSRLRL
jgi:hypothetical protein